MTPDEEKFLEELTALCHKHKMYLGAAREEILFFDHFEGQHNETFKFQIVYAPWNGIEFKS